ncbi:hypothetical protein [Vibrio salinus]|uniref:hypothetical protein n=1 Tax=Vibrio salinus TaxID=2899784 RepID=UPI001E466080|nr:hypothetical protein [Vibrio salinus]MCE0495771.1 hypothetical protein [Vibrio salinus]
MAKIKAPSMHDAIYVGTHGNLSLAKTQVTLAAAAINDVVEMVEIPVGIDIQALRISTSGLGDNVVADIRIGDTTLASDLDLSGEYSQTIACDHYTEEKSIITVTIRGAAATGTLNVNPEYLATGY